jgi:hypothetical protein
MKRKEDMRELFLQEKEKKEEKKETTFGDKSFINHHHMPCQNDKGEAVRLMKPRNNRFGHREVLYELPKRRGHLPRANT